MSYWKRLKQETARTFLARILENVVTPGRDPIPHVGAKLLDKRGHLWEVKGHGIHHEGNKGSRWWPWDSDVAREIGPLLATDEARR